MSSEAKKESVMKLFNRGFDIERISDLLNMSKSEVKLIIDVEQK